MLIAFAEGVDAQRGVASQWQTERKDKDMEMIEEKKEWLTERKQTELIFFLSAVAEPDDLERTLYCCQQ